MRTAPGSTAVVGLDRSDHGRAAADYAAAVADRRHLPLRLVQAFEPPAVRPPAVRHRLDTQHRRCREQLVPAAAR
jgi:hypothetical protein